VCLAAACLAATSCGEPRSGVVSAEGTAQQAAPQANTAAPTERPPILARVNDEAIQRWEVEAAIREIEYLNVHPVPAAERDEFFKAVLDRIIGHHLVAQEARARKLQVSDMEVDADIAKMRQEFPSEKAFTDTLASLHTSLDQLRAQRRLSLEVAHYVRAAIAPTVSVTEAEIQAYYRDNPERFEEPETAVASHILILTRPDSSSEELTAAHAQATAILGELRKGADFADLARKRSQDPRTAARGGRLDVFPKGQMDPDFEAAAFALEAGDVSDVVQTSLGFHVIKMHERHTGQTATLEETRSAIRDLLTERMQQEKLAAMIELAKAKATIQVFN
jgi:parvulin-like peptidyl-prolyl isomerase